MCNSFSPHHTSSSAIYSFLHHPLTIPLQLLRVSLHDRLHLLAHIPGPPSTRSCRSASAAYITTTFSTLSGFAGSHCTSVAFTGTAWGGSAEHPRRTSAKSSVTSSSSGSRLLVNCHFKSRGQRRGDDVPDERARARALRLALLQVAQEALIQFAPVLDRERVRNWLARELAEDAR
jgi:hypothetical protein